MYVLGGIREGTPAEEAGSMGSCVNRGYIWQVQNITFTTDIQGQLQV